MPVGDAVLLHLKQNSTTSTRERWFKFDVNGHPGCGDALRNALIRKLSVQSDGNDIGKLAVGVAVNPISHDRLTKQMYLRVWTDATPGVLRAAFGAFLELKAVIYAPEGLFSSVFDNLGIGEFWLIIASVGPISSFLPKLERFLWYVGFGRKDLANSATSGSRIVFRR